MGGHDVTDCVAAGAVRGPGTQAAGLGFSLAPENGRPTGIWSHGATAWVADLDAGKLFAYRLSDGSRSPERDLGVGGLPMGLWSDGVTLWVAELTCRRHSPAEPSGARVALLPRRRRPSPYLRRVGFRIALFEACSAFTARYGLCAR